MNSESSSANRVSADSLDSGPNRFFANLVSVRSSALFHAGIEGVPLTLDNLSNICPTSPKSIPEYERTNTGRASMIPDWEDLDPDNWGKAEAEVDFRRTARHSFGNTGSDSPSKRKAKEVESAPRRASMSDVRSLAATRKESEYHDAIEFSQREAGALSRMYRSRSIQVAEFRKSHIALEKRQEVTKRATTIPDFKSRWSSMMGGPVPMSRASFANKWNEQSRSRKPTIRFDSCASLGSQGSGLDTQAFIEAFRNTITNARITTTTTSPQSNTHRRKKTRYRSKIQEMECAVPDEKTSMAEWVASQAQAPSAA